MSREQTSLGKKSLAQHGSLMKAVPVQGNTSTGEEQQHGEGPNEACEYGGEGLNQGLTCGPTQMLVGGTLSYLKVF